MPNKRKNIGIIIHRTDESMCQNLLNSLADVMVPDGYEVIATVLDNSSSKAASYNEGMQQINGEIKLYTFPFYMIRFHTTLIYSAFSALYLGTLF